MECRRSRWWGLACCLLAIGGLVLAGCDAGEQSWDAPSLASAYDDLAGFWEEAAASLGIDPDAGRLEEWKVGYDEEGRVLYQSFKVYVDRGAGGYDLYYYSQDVRSGPDAHWYRLRVRNPKPDRAVPAHEVFSALNQIGFRELEEHQGLEPPVRFWFLAESGATTVKPSPLVAGTYLAVDGEITPVGSEGAAIQGKYGVFGIAKGAVSAKGEPVQTAFLGSPGPARFVLALSQSEVLIDTETESE